MSEKKDNSLDILGVKDFGKAIDRVTEASIDAASAFLSSICLPATKEFGLLLKDKVSFWITKNAIKIAFKTQEYYEKYKLKGKQVHPRIVFETLEKGSWCDDQTLQSMWGGLMASSCSEEGNDDSNIIFTGLLSQMTSVQVKILNYSCEKAQKFLHKNDLPFAQDLTEKTTAIMDLTNLKDLNRLDFELDHLRKLDLLHGGFSIQTTEIASLTPTPLALNLYVRCNGFKGPPEDYWNLKRERATKTEQNT